MRGALRRGQEALFHSFTQRMPRGAYRSDAESGGTDPAAGVALPRALRSGQTPPLLQIPREATSCPDRYLRDPRTTPESGQVPQLADTCCFCSLGVLGHPIFTKKETTYLPEVGLDLKV